MLWIVLWSGGEPSRRAACDSMQIVVPGVTVGKFLSGRELQVQNVAVQAGLRVRGGATVCDERADEQDVPVSHPQCVGSLLSRRSVLPSRCDPGSSLSGPFSSVIGSR